MTAVFLYSNFVSLLNIFVLYFSYYYYVIDNTVSLYCKTYEYILILLCYTQGWRFFNRIFTLHPIIRLKELNPLLFG